MRKIATLIILTQLFLSSLVYGQTASVTGDVLNANSSSNPSINLTITVTYLESKTANRQTDEKTLKDRIGIIFPDSGNQYPIQTKLGAQAEQRNNDFYWNYDAITEPVVQQTNDGKFKIVYTITVLQNVITNRQPEKTLKNIAGNDSLKVKIRFYTFDSTSKEYKTNASDSPEFMIEKIYAAPDEAPENFGAKAANERISVEWETKEEITYQDNVKRKSPSAIAIVISHKDLPETILPLNEAAKISDGKKDDDKPGRCSFNPQYGEGEECISCTSNTYLQVDQLKNEKYSFGKYTKYSTTLSDDGDASIGGLENDQTYTVVLQYSGGIKRTGCFQISPKANYTLSEIYGDAKAEEEDVRCFIATAAFGSPLNPHVKVFRWFRSKFLLSFDLGKKFVRFYYNTSPKYAAIIEQNSILKSITVAALYPIAIFLHIVKFFVNYPIYFIILLFSTAAVGFRRKISIN